MKPEEATKFVIEKSGMKQSQVAAAMQMSKNTLHNYVAGKCYPNIATFAELCKVCRVSVHISNGEIYFMKEV